MDMVSICDFLLNAIIIFEKKKWTTKQRSSSEERDAEYHVVMEGNCILRAPRPKLVAEFWQVLSYIA